jgi:hypothetical protein
VHRQAVSSKPDQHSYSEHPNNGMDRRSLLGVNRVVFSLCQSTSGLSPSTEIIRPLLLVRLAQEAKDRENCKGNIAKWQGTFCLANDNGK